MVKALFTKQLNALRPASAQAEDLLRGIRQGELVSVDLKRPRNLIAHRRFWALMTLVHQNVDHTRWPAVEDLVDAVKIMVGCRRTIWSPAENGWVYLPASISFAKMDESSFEKFYDRVCDLLAQHFLPGVTNAQLRHEVSELIGVSP